MTKAEIVEKYVRRRLKNLNSPQVFGLPLIHKDLKEPRHPGGGSYIDNYFGNIRRAGMLREVGRIRSGVYYVFTAKALGMLKRDPSLLRRWIVYGKRWNGVQANQ